jgi:NADP-dependent 3-hydroxy acid dehydrogenase YdfG
MSGKRRFSDQVVIITGASSGLGFALAKAFAREGAATVLAARSADTLQRAVEEIQNLHSKMLAIPTDVSLRADVENLVERTIAQFGRIDLLINNAGSAYGGLIEEAEFADNLRKMLDVSLYGKVYAVQAVLPVMKRQQAGHIVNISSVLGRKAFPRFGAYSMAMHAVSAFTDALRQELRGTGIGVTSVHPGLIQSALYDHVKGGDLPPQFKAITPLAADDVAAKIVAAVHKKCVRVVVPKQPLLLLLADTLSPRFGDFVMRLLEHQTVTRILGLYNGRGLDRHGNPKEQ